MSQFVLKHEIFRELRELDYCLGTLNPHRDQGVKLVQEMLRQVMELHPKSSCLHIGADEVQFKSELKKSSIRQSLTKDVFVHGTKNLTQFSPYNAALYCCIVLMIVICIFTQVYMLGLGDESKHWLSIPGHSVEHLFLSHVIKVAKGIRETVPNLNLIMWDDMLRSMTSETIKGACVPVFVKYMLFTLHHTQFDIYLIYYRNYISFFNALFFILESGLVGLVQPMLWDYSPTLDVANTGMLAQQFITVILNSSALS